MPGIIPPDYPGIIPPDHWVPPDTTLQVTHNPAGFEIGDVVTIHLPNGNSLTGAMLHDWTPEGVTFTRKGLIQFMPWVNVWMIAQPEREG